MPLDAYLGEITIFAGTFAPRGYAFCDGSLLPIMQNAALFSLLGTTYGGDGYNTFALPDLRGRVPMGAGKGPDTSNRRLGEKVGSEQAPLETMNVTVSVEGEDVATTQALAVKPPSDTATPAVPTVPPSTVLNYIIATEGIFPSRW